MSRTRVALIDDHLLLRETLRLLVDAQPDLHVVAEAGNFGDGLTAVRDQLPDVVILDITLPGGSGIKLTEKLLRERPGTRVLMLTMHEDPSYLRAAVAAGCAGYVLKSSSPAVFLQAVRAIRDGKQFVDPALGDASASAKPARARKQGVPPSTLLSNREIQVLTLLAQGLSYSDISEKLCLSVKTVETYRTRLGVKLGFASKADLVRYAIESGLLAVQPERDPD